LKKLTVSKNVFVSKMSSSDNVRVCARFRPVNKVEKEENAHIVIKIPQNSQVNITRLGFEQKMFFLDYMFPPNATQANVYEYAGKPLISEIMKGYNGTIFAYGQTGSGKTHTMQGDLENDRQRGLVPRMIDAIFDEIMDSDEKLEFVIKVSYVEIYLERIRDLLDEKRVNLKIRESSAQGIYIEGVSQPYVGSPEEILEFIQQGANTRSTSAHRMNDVSSRSHAVFIFRLITTHKDTQSKKISKLMLVDLAGSEKTRKTQAQGKRLEEAKQINQSLSTLGKVINSLTSSNRHVPYRESKLTRLLTDSLGGNSKTCIIVTCSPCDYNVEETISTLRFGVNCKKVKNIPKINEELSIREYKDKIKKMTDREKSLLKRIAVLESQVKALKEALIAAGGDVDEALKNAQQEIDALEEEKAMEQENEQRNRSKSHRETQAGAAARQVLAAMDGGNDAGLMLLKERIDELELLYNQEADQKENYLDDIADVRSELEVAEVRIRDLEQEAERMNGKRQESDSSMKKMAEQMAEFRMYKLKFETIQKENELEMMEKRKEIGELNHRLKKMNERLLDGGMGLKGEDGPELGPLSEKQQDALMKFDPDNIDNSLADGEWKEQMNERYNQLYRRLLKEMQTNRELRVSAAMDGPRDKLDLDIASATLVETNRILEKRLKEQKKQCDSLRKEIRCVEQRERFNSILRQKGKDQLAQVEKMLVLANQIHNRDRVRFSNQIQDRDSELRRLKTFVTKITKSRGNKSRHAGMRRMNVMVPVKRTNSTGSAKDEKVRRVVRPVAKA